MVRSKTNWLAVLIGSSAVAYPGRGLQTPYVPKAKRPARTRDRGRQTKTAQLRLFRADKQRASGHWVAPRAIDLPEVGEMCGGCRDHTKKAASPARVSL